MKRFWASCDQCGWTTRRGLRSQAQAEFAHRQHSCEKKRAADVSRARGEARDAAVDRTPKPCHHKQADHQHGTYAAYTHDRCRCLPCAVAASEYDRALAKRKAYGRHDYIDAEPARRHVRTLIDAGVGLKRITATSGVSQGAMWKLMYGKRRPDGTQVPSRRITRATAEALLALDPHDLRLPSDGAKIDSTGTARRLQALATLGWSVSRLAGETGLDRQRLDGALHGRPVLAATARAVAATYDRLWNTPAPASSWHEKAAAARTASHAAKARYAPPLAWDDDAIDDPAAKPAHQLKDEHGTGVDDAAIERALAGERVTLTRAERWTVVRRLHAQGLSDGEIARHAHLVDRTVLRDRQALGLPANFYAPDGKTAS